MGKHCYVGSTPLSTVTALLRKCYAHASFSMQVAQMNCKPCATWHLAAVVRRHNRHHDMVAHQYWYPRIPRSSFLLRSPQLCLVLVDT